MKREPGYYFVAWRTRGELDDRIARWDGRCWIIGHSTHDWFDSDLAEIGPRVPTPDEWQAAQDEIERLRAIAQQASEARYWHDADGTPCDGFRFREEGEKLDMMLMANGFKSVITQAATAAGGDNAE